MMLIIDDGDVVDKSPWPDVETGNMICAVGLHSLLRDKLASKIADDEEDANFCGKRIYFYCDILPYLPKTWYWVTDLHESWRIWLFLLCSFQSNIEGAQGECIWTWVPLNYIMEHCDFLVLEGIMGRRIESYLNIDWTNYVWIESYFNYVWIT